MVLLSTPIIICRGLLEGNPATPFREILMMEQDEPSSQFVTNYTPSNTDAARDRMERDSRLFQSLLMSDEETEKELVDIDIIIRDLHQAGLHLKGLNISHRIDELKKESDGKVNFNEFIELIANSHDIIERTLQGRLVIPDWPSFCAILDQLFLKSSVLTGGEVATYIPKLAQEDPEKWGFSFCSVDGQQHHTGDSSYPFCLQSVSKPITYLIALELYGEEHVHRFVGREPSGRHFNELSLDDYQIPHNPMINAGSIMCCSLIKPECNMATRFDFILSFFRRAAGHSGHTGFSNTVYLSERSTADRNFCLAYMMQEQKAFQQGRFKDLPARSWNRLSLKDTLDLYFQCCSIEMNAKALAVVAATLANGGLCPRTNRRVFQAKHVKHALCLMATCGMYDYSGEWGYHIGLPAKSGVSGAIIVVIPNVGGYCTFGPKLDRLGNSVRGIAFCQELVNHFNFHVYDHLKGVLTPETNKNDPRCGKAGQDTFALFDRLFRACAAGDLTTVKQLVACGADVKQANPDDRTPLHIAATEGHLPVVQYLIKHGASLSCVDRWNSTPKDSARLEEHTAIVNYLDKFQEDVSPPSHRKRRLNVSQTNDEYDTQ